MVMDIVIELSEKIGERTGGSDEEKEAAKLVMEKMRKIGLTVETQSFKFLGWKPTKGPVLELLEPEKRKLSPGLMPFSDNAPEGGVIGKVEPVGTMYIIEGMFEWPKYAVVDERGHHLAYIVAFPEGPAITMPLCKMGRWFGFAPYVQIGQEDYKQFQNWLNEGKTVRVRVDVGGELLPGLISQNIIGTLKGKTLPEEEIVISAHYDSAYGSPGAWDNASGVEGMLRIAERLAEKGTHKTIKFVAFGCEEYLMLGSYYYVETLKEQGLLFKTKAVINLDAIGAGKTLHILTAPKSFRRMVEAIVEESGLKEEISIVFEDPVGDSDHWPFYLEGIPVVTSYFWPYDHYHQPTDTAEKIQEDKIEKTARVMQTIAERLAYARARCWF